MFVTEASVSATSELTLQIDISMPNLTTSQPDLSFSGSALTPRVRNNTKYYSNTLRRSERLTGSDMGLNKKKMAAQSVYHRRCAADDVTSSERSQHGGSDPALSPSTSQSSGCQHKKPFITVVKSGTFLDPPSEAMLLREKTHQSQVLVYSYCSKPRAMPPTYKQNKSGSRENHINHNNNNTTTINNNNYTFYPHNKTLLQTYNTRNKRHTEVYQQQDGSNPYGNIMSDRRVVRGSNFAQHPPTTQPKWNPNFGYAKLLSQPAERQEEARRRAAARRRARPKAFRRLGTPPPVDGRRHTDVQTEGRYEEILDRPHETDTGCQTEPWERPVPQYEPVPAGVDRETQVMPGELFDFEHASQPVVARVVSRALEQALAEVLQEEEVAGLRAQQRRLHELRLAEWAEARRVAERENKLQREKERSTREHEAAAQEQRRAEERAAAAALSQAMLEELLPSVLAGLKEAGQIPDPVQDEVSTGLVPWLVEEVAQEMRQMITSRHVLTDIVREVLETRAELRQALGDEAADDDEDVEDDLSDEEDDVAAAKSEQETEEQQS